MGYNYDGISDSALLTQIETRKSHGSNNFEDINPSSGRPAIIAALQKDDADAIAARDSKQVAEGAVEIPKSTAIPAREPAQSGTPEDSEFTEHAIYRATGDTFAVAYHIKRVDGQICRLANGEPELLPDTYGKTITAKNDRYFWQGNETDYAACFRPIAKAAPADSKTE